MVFKYFKIFLERKNYPERVTNDTIIRMVIINIKNKRNEFDTDIIVPRYKEVSVTYQGETYKKHSFLKDYLKNPKVTNEIKTLIDLGCKQNFENYAQIQHWIEETTGISSCHLAVFQHL